MRSTLAGNRKRARLLMAVALVLSLALTTGWFEQPAYGISVQGKGKKSKKAKKDAKSNKEQSAQDASSAEATAAAESEQISESSADGKKKKDKKGKKGKKVSLAPAVAGQPILWVDRGNVSELDLYWGAGSQELAPKPPFTFDKEDKTGTNPKIKVIDANGVKWNIKFDEEVHAEVAASRLAWACGYLVEENYFVPSGRVNGVKGLTRARKFVAADGSFAKGMFEKRPDTVARRNIRWTWESNPFVGTKELSGLAILNTMLNNWDAKVDNNNVLGVYGEDEKVYDWYVQSDWGGTFGKTGGYFSHTKWDLEDFARQKFIDGVSGGKLRLHYTGKMSSSLKTVPVEHAKWFAGIVGQLSDSQIRDAFRAAGATDAEADGFTAKLREKIEELKRAVSQ